TPASIPPSGSWAWGKRRPRSAGWSCHLSSTTPPTLTSTCPGAAIFTRTTTCPERRTHRERVIMKIESIKAVSHTVGYIEPWAHDKRFYAKADTQTNVLVKITAEDGTF